MTNDTGICFGCDYYNESLTDYEHDDYGTIGLCLECNPNTN
jgi:hypothetical protein